MRTERAILPLVLAALLVIAGCTHYACSPPKHYHDPWVANGETYPTIEACMTAIWDVGVCSDETPAVADLQIRWALDCRAYCQRVSEKDHIKSCMGVSMNQDHGRPLCKRVPLTTADTDIIAPWYIICSDLSATCQCVPMRKKKRR